MFYFIKMEVTDIRNDQLLVEACRVDVDQFCGNVEPGEGRVLDCLRMHRFALTAAHFSPPLPRPSSATLGIRRADRCTVPSPCRLCCCCCYCLLILIFAAALREELPEALCAPRRPQRPRTGRFLSHYSFSDARRSSLSPPCRGEEQLLSQIQGSDVRLRPKLMKLCGQEMVLFCSDTKPGGGRMFTCLLENAGKNDFGAACREEVCSRPECFRHIHVLA